MDLYLQDKVVLVTGGGAGIGAAIAHVLAAEGAIPVLVTNAAPEAALLADLQRLQPRTEVNCATRRPAAARSARRWRPSAASTGW